MIEAKSTENTDFLLWYVGNTYFDVTTEQKKAAAISFPEVLSLLIVHNMKSEKMAN